MRFRKYILLVFLLYSFVPLRAQVYEAWVARYDGEGNSVDRAHSLAVDDSANVYVTGLSLGLTSFDYATIKYSSSGDTLWVRRYNGPGNSHDIATAIVMDVSGNVYVTGGSVGSNTFYDYATIKYSPAGDTLWVRRYNGPGDDDDRASALAVDDSGNVFVSGMSYADSTSYDYLTIKYSPAGDTLWVRRYNGPGNSFDYANALTVDNSGNVYVTGESYGSGTFSDYATIKYSSAGDTLWVRRYNGPGDSLDCANALTVDDSRNVYVTGKSFGIVTFFEDYATDDYATIKYDSNGDTLWTRRYNDPGNSADVANALAVDGNGNVYVTGHVSSSDYATIKYNPNGDTTWVKRYSQAGNDFATALAVDNNGNAYVTGYSWGTSFDYATIKYSSFGDTLWVIRYNGPGNGSDEAYAIALDNSGNLYVTGGSDGGNLTGSDYTTIKYSPCTAKSGDVNNDDRIRLSDIITIVNFAFRSHPPPSPMCRADANADGNITFSDMTYLINFLFKSGPAPLKSKECCL